MALNDIKVPKENAGGTFDEVALSPGDIGAVSTSDSRLTDSRTPTAHTHGNLTNAGAIGTTANLPLKTGTNGVVEAGSFGTAAGSFCEGNDARLSDDRDPNLHAASHLPDGADELFDQSLNTTDSPQFTNVTSNLIVGPLAAIDLANGTFSDAAQNFSTFEWGNQLRVFKPLELCDETDTTKRAIFDISNVTTNTTRYLEIQNADGVIALVDDIPTTASDLGAAASGSITTSGLTQATARILGRTSSSTGAVEEIQIGSGLSLSAGELSATSSGGVVGSTGSTDNSILRSDGTGGSTAQASALVVNDEVAPFNVTGSAATDILTAVGHNFSTNQLVRFLTLTGATGNFFVGNQYFVRDISGDTFKLAASSGGAAINFTTDITAGTIVAPQNFVALRNVSAETNSALVLCSKGTGGFIVSPTVPDGTTSGGNNRGSAAVCIVPNRTQASHVASGNDSICVGASATSSGSASISIGASSTCSGSNSVAVGGSTQATAINATAIGLGIASLRGQFSTAAFNAIYWGGQTTNATPLILNLDASATNRFTIAANTALAVDVLLVARRSDVADKWLVARRFLGIRRDGSNNTSLIGSVQTLGTDQSAGSPSWSFTLTADDTNEALQLEVTGAASETVQWRATAFYRVV
jgi:hypothetical protein